MKTFSYTDAAAKLKEMGESHLLSSWEHLTQDEETTLLEEINALDSAIFAKQQQALSHHLKEKQQETKQNFKHFTDFSLIGSEEHKKIGKELIAQGKIGCLLVAGGQATRLSYDGPKGTFPISLVKKKSLFQLFAEKTLAAGKDAQKPLLLAIMTSPQNHTATLDFFQKNLNFGLADEQLYFFTQNELPFLDNQGHLLLKNGCTIAKGPNGNGCALDLFLKSGIWESWNKQGVEFLNYVLIDNPLADPFDAELVGFHVATGSEITVKCTERTDPEERAGLLVDSEDGICIIEYTELQDEEKRAVLPNGRLKHRCMNLSLFCFSIDFIKGTTEFCLPWHFAYKPIQTKGPHAWKFETFIFDYLKASKAIKALIYPRSHCFAPLKKISGRDSLETVQASLLHQDQMILESLCDHPISCGTIELDQQFHYPTNELTTHWKGLKGPFQGYLTPLDYRNYTYEQT